MRCPSALRSGRQSEISDGSDEVKMMCENYRLRGVNAHASPCSREVVRVGVLQRASFVFHPSLRERGSGNSDRVCVGLRARRFRAVARQWREKKERAMMQPACRSETRAYTRVNGITGRVVEACGVPLRAPAETPAELLRPACRIADTLSRSSANVNSQLSKRGDNEARGRRPGGRRQG